MALFNSLRSFVPRSLEMKNSKQKFYTQYMFPSYIKDRGNQYALNLALGRIRHKYGWSEREGLDGLSVLHANLVGQERFSSVFFPDWHLMTNTDGRTIRSQLHNPAVNLRSWDLLLNECLVAQSEDEEYSEYVAKWRQQYLNSDTDD